MNFQHLSGTLVVAVFQQFMLVSSTFSFRSVVNYYYILATWLLYVYNWPILVFRSILYMYLITIDLFLQNWYETQLRIVARWLRNRPDFSLHPTQLDSSETLLQVLISQKSVRVSRLHTKWIHRHLIIMSGWAMFYWCHKLSPAKHVLQYVLMLIMHTSLKIWWTIPIMCVIYCSIT